MELNYPRLFHQLILALSKVLDIDEARKLNHAQRTAVLSHLLASKLCPPERDLVYYAALLHDIGGIGLFDSIVHHPSPVVQAANPAIRVHPIVGAQIVDNVPGMERCVPLILNHHECYDGHGYPGGKSAQHLSIGAQIIRGADSFDLLLHFMQEAASENGKLQAAYAQKSGKEISPEMADLVCQLIGDSAIFSFLTDDKAIREKCQELNKELYGFTPPKGMDVIGTFLEVFAQVIDTKHTYTAGHSQRVSKYSVHIGLAMGLPHDDITTLKWAALIHDLGKVAIPRHILDSTLPLSKEELSLIKHHPKFTIEILSCVTELTELGRFGAYHHERWDGKGYAEGLKGEDIPLLSRVICVADSFDSLTSDRSYRKAIGTRIALEKLAKSSGTQFDPNVFEIAKSALWSGTT